jgi:hypothetical protein
MKHNSIMLHSLRDSLNRCILRAHVEGGLESDPWWSLTPPYELDTKRICEQVASSVFVATLWVGEVEGTLYDQMGRLNLIKVKLEQYIEMMDIGCPPGKVSKAALKIWKDATDSHGVEVDDAMKGFELLGEILCISNPLKFQYALDCCAKTLSLKLEICRLYSEDLDTVVGLISMQIERIQQKGLKDYLTA